jgi:hypothetical protein
MSTQFVNAYAVERCYGGPEEGGWWFDAGQPIESRVCGTDAEVEAARAELRAKYPRTDKRYSVLGGDDYSVIVEDHPGCAYPTEWPRYE